MDRMKDALLRVVKAADGIEDLRKAFVKIGINDNALYEIRGQLVDAVSYMIGENDEVREEFGDSTAYCVLTNPDLAVDQRMEKLLAEYRKNTSLQAYDEHILDHPEQPKPNVMSREEFDEMYRRNGGYRYETPEGDWE